MRSWVLIHFRCKSRPKFEANFHSNNTSRCHGNFYCPQFARVFFSLNNSMKNKWFDFKIPFRNVSTIILFFYRISKAHCVRILSCFGPKVDVWLRVWLIFLAIWLFSLVLFTTFRTWFGLPHPSIVGIP